MFSDQQSVPHYPSSVRVVGGGDEGNTRYAQPQLVGWLQRYLAVNDNVS